MIKRKQYLIAPTFQKKISFSVVGTIMLFNAIILLGLIAILIHNNTKIRHVQETQDEIANYFRTRVFTEDKVKVDNTMRKLILQSNASVIQLDKITTFNGTVLIVSVGIMLLLSILAYTLLIRKTHKIAGPLYLMTNHAREVLDGKVPVLRPLRKSDELQDFYELFIEVLKRGNFGSRNT